MKTQWDYALSRAAIQNLEECGLTPETFRADRVRICQGLSADDLLAECLDGSEPDREYGWRDYVWAVFSAEGLSINHNGMVRT